MCYHVIHAVDTEGVYGMYNEGVKRDFINAFGMDKWKFRWATATFNSVERAEEKLGKDIAEMTADEVGTALGSSDVTSSATLANRIPFIARYKSWCIDNGIPAVLVRSSDIHVNISDNIRDTMVYSASNLLSIVNEAFPEKSANDSKCIYKAHLWFAFSGMQDLDSVRVRVSDIDFNQCSVFLDNRMYFFSELGKRDIRHACEMLRFDRIVNGKSRSFKREDGDKVLRGRETKNGPADDRSYLVKTLRSAVRFGFSESGHPGMSYIRIRKSGIFSESFSREARGVPVNFYQVAHDDFVFDGKTATAGQTKQKILRRLILSYEKDYEAWKRAFENELKHDFGLENIPHQFEW